jgi:hypothetical protein
MILEKKNRMRKPYLSIILGFLAVSTIALNSCNKRIGMESNGNELATPYSVYFADSAGILYNSNDGDVVKKLIFPADGYPSRALAVTGEKHIVWIKKNAHYTMDNGGTFGPTYFYVNPASYNQSALLYARDQERVYIASSQNWGVAYNENHGQSGEWQDEAASNWDNTISAPVSITSYTQMSNGFIWAYDDVNNRLFRKDNKNDPWTEVVPDTSNFKHHWFSMSLASYKNVLVAIDSTDSLGAWFSMDGVAWSEFTGLPHTTKTAVANAPFNEELFVGTYYHGLYRLEGGVMIPSNEGIDANTIVRGIKGKYERYKNNSERRVIYLATNTGIYRSVDIGRNWVKIKEGNFINVY